VLGSLFMRHLHITFERHEQVVYMHEDHCGDDEWVGLEVAPSSPGERVDAVQVSLYAPELNWVSPNFPVVTDGVTESNWEVVVVDASQVTVVQLANMPENTFLLSVDSGSSISFGRPRLGVGDSTIVDPHLSGDFAAGGELTPTPGSLIIEYGCEATGFSTLRLTLPFDDPAIPDASWMWSVDCREGVLDVIDDDSCRLANDGHCDEPYECDMGTDTTDCSQAGFENGNNMYCQYTDDGECDEVQYCPAGSDTHDCCLGGEPRTTDASGRSVTAAHVCCDGDCVPPGPDWCQYANDGTCDEPFLGTGECPIGSDTTDCAGVVPSCPYTGDGECDEGTYCDAGSDTTDCCEDGQPRERDVAGRAVDASQVDCSVAGTESAPDTDNSCALANNGQCDEPYECDMGTDTMDCSQAGFENGNSQYCQYAGDGECDEIDFCPAGSDTVDCCLDGAPRAEDQYGTPVVAANVCCGGNCLPPGPDWCQYANDGACDEPPIGYECPIGTDSTDCDAAADLSCRYADDDECDEGPEAQYCLPGTDFNDCCDAVGQVKVWPPTYSDGMPRPDAGRVVAGNADCSAEAAGRAGTAFDISVHGDDGNSCTWANDRE
jgi:hypothetical protein